MVALKMKTRYNKVQGRRAAFFAALFFAVLFTVGGTGFPKDISVTSVRVTGDMAQITINDTLVIKEIQVSRERAAGEVSLKFPEFVSRSGKIYPQMRILSKQADDAIKKAIGTGKATEKPLEWDLKKDLRLTKLEKHRTKPTYFASVSFGDAIEVECKFQRRDDKIKILWPARPPDVQGGKWFNQIYFVKKELREIAEKPLEEQFLKKEKELLLELGEKDGKKSPPKEDQPKQKEPEGDE